MGEWADETVEEEALEEASNGRGRRRNHARRKDRITSVARRENITPEMSEEEEKTETKQA